MELPVPVFLCVADIPEKKLYFVPVKNQVRTQYKKFSKQSSLSFTLSEHHSFADDSGLMNFIICYIQEKNFRDLTDLSRNLLIHLPQYCEFIYNQQELDPFIGLEPEEELMFIHIYLTIHNLWNICAIDWGIDWIADIIKKDKKTWENTDFSDYYLHNLTMTEIFPSLEKKLIEVLDSIKTIITDFQKEYWEQKEYILYRKALDLDTSKLTELVFQ